MSVDVLISPRISFSHNVRETENDSNSLPIETYSYSSSSLDTGFDFDFAFIVDSHGSLIRESSTADELFSDGKLLPISIDFAPNRENPTFPCFETEDKIRIVKSLKEHLEDSIDIEEEQREDEATGVGQLSAIRTFWNFHRSNSLNRAKLNIPSKLRLLSRSKSIGGGVGIFSPKPVKEDHASEDSPSPRSIWKIILPRSNSTGVVLEKNKMEKEDSHNQEDEDKEKKFGIRRSSSLNCNGRNYGRGLIVGRSNSTGSAANLKQDGKKEVNKQSSAGKKDKGQGRRSYRDHYGNSNRSERVNSVLNLPSPYISRVSVDLLGLGSFFCTSKSRKKNK